MMSSSREAHRPTSGTTGQPKHRACDECRTRKLACSKEPDGCRRCKREGVACVYSAQKTMGRPRKRPRVEAAAAAAVTTTTTTTTTQETEATAFVPTESASGDAELSFLADLPPSGFNLFDLFGISETEPEPEPVPEPEPPTAFMPGLLDVGLSAFQSTDTGASTEATTSDSPPCPVVCQPLCDDPSLFFRDEGAQAATQRAHGRILGGGCVEAPSRACGCLARLYLALDGLQRLPDAVAGAMTVARSAARAAHDTIVCPSCSPPDFAEVGFAPPLQSYQNLMMLAALLPSIAHAYQQIVRMVDAEAARALAARQQLALGVKAYGGLWGGLGAHGFCGHTEAIEGSLVDPPLWRLATRALLRIDVYGLHEAAADEDGRPKHVECQGALGGLEHLGLRDIVDLLERRAKMRHDCLDAAVDAGLVDNATERGYVRLPPGEKHSCQRVIEMARREVDRLVIA